MSITTAPAVDADATMSDATMSWSAVFMRRGYPARPWTDPADP